MQVEWRTRNRGHAGPMNSHVRGDGAPPPGTMPTRFLNDVTSLQLPQSGKGRIDVGVFTQKGRTKGGLIASHTRGVPVLLLFFALLPNASHPAAHFAPIVRRHDRPDSAYIATSAALANEPHCFQLELSTVSPRCCHLPPPIPKAHLNLVSTEPGAGHFAAGRWGIRFTNAANCHNSSSL